MNTSELWRTATDPKNYTEDQLRSVLELAFNFFGDYHRGAFRGAEMSWDDLDATHEAAAPALPELRAMALEYWGREYFDADYFEDSKRCGEAEEDEDYEIWFNQTLEEFRE